MKLNGIETERKRKREGDRKKKKEREKQASHLTSPQLLSCKFYRQSRTQWIYKKKKNDHHRFFLSIQTVNEPQNIINYESGRGGRGGKKEKREVNDKNKGRRNVKKRRKRRGGRGGEGDK